MIVLIFLLDDALNISLLDLQLLVTHAHKIGLDVLQKIQHTLIITII